MGHEKTIGKGDDDDDDDDRCGDVLSSDDKSGRIANCRISSRRDFAMITS